MRFCDLYLQGFRSNEVETKRKEKQSTKKVTKAIKLGEMCYKIFAQYSYSKFDIP